MSNEKGGLIKKKKMMQPAKPVAKPDQKNAFSYKPKVESKPVKETKEAKADVVAAEPEVAQPAPTVKRKSTKPTLEDIKANLTVGRNSVTKSIRAPEFVYEELSLLSSFVEPTKMYEIMQLMIDSYIKHELTPRQQKQYEYMLETKFLKNKED